eukprot:4215766-Heterocapsa_arctica.AAC.1
MDGLLGSEVSERPPLRAPRPRPPPRPARQILKVVYLFLPRGPASGAHGLLSGGGSPLAFGRVVAPPG